MLAGGTRQKGFRMEDKTGFCWWRLEGGGEQEGSRNMLGGGGRIRCAVCADESFSFEKNKQHFSELLWRQILSSLFVLNLSGWSHCVWSVSGLKSTENAKNE